jgi:hypothetical protein
MYINHICLLSVMNRLLQDRICREVNYIYLVTLKWASFIQDPLFHKHGPRHIFSLQTVDLGIKCLTMTIIFICTH